MRIIMVCTANGIETGMCVVVYLSNRLNGYIRPHYSIKRPWQPVYNTSIICQRQIKMGHHTPGINTRIRTACPGNAYPVPKHKTHSRLYCRLHTDCVWLRLPAME